MQNRATADLGAHLALAALTGLRIASGVPWPLQALSFASVTEAPPHAEDVDEWDSARTRSEAAGARSEAAGERSS